MNCLLEDYVFPPFPLPFEKYLSNAGWLDQPHLELQTTPHLFFLFYSAEQIRACGAKDFSMKSSFLCEVWWQWTTHYCVCTFRLQLISHLPTQLFLAKKRINIKLTLKNVNTLSHFRGLFNDHRRPIRTHTISHMYTNFFTIF